MPRGKDRSEDIRREVVEFLKKQNSTVKYKQVVKYLKDQFPDIQESTIHAYMHKIRKKVENGDINEIVLVDRGLYQYNNANESQNFEFQEITQRSIREEEFYEKFANYLENELEECTGTIVLGGNIFGDKWGTPDVLGVYKFQETDPIKPPLEIVSAEIKIDTNQLITAFGQACAYKTFSHKVYLVVPEQAEADLSRIESLCMRFGIGLIIFDKNNPQDPNFKIRTRALKSDPDYYYVNKYIQKLDRNQIRQLLK